MKNEWFKIDSLGDSALIVSFENVISEEVNNQVLMMYEKLKSLSIRGIVDVVPAYTSLTIHYDISVAMSDPLKNKTVFEYFSEKIKDTVPADERLIFKSNYISIPVCYADHFAPDIYEIAKQKGLTRDEIVNIHTGKKYKVFMIGFLPGFPYMGKVDERIAVPRKDRPRMNIEAGSVGIAGTQTGIYSLDSPGGWQIIGKTPVEVFKKNDAVPSLLKPGDIVEFYSISEDEFARY